MNSPITMSAEEAESLEAELQSQSGLSEYLPSPIEANGTNGHSLPEMVDAFQFIAVRKPEPRQLVNGILHQGSKLSLGGGSKSFKTWTLLDIAVSVSHGAPWLSFKTDPGRVLYLNFEIPEWAWQQRIETIAKAKGVTIEPERLVLWNLRGHAAPFDVLIPKIIERAKTMGFVLIICDPIYKMYGRTDENKAGDVAQLMNAIEAMTVQTEASTAFGAHFSKGNQAGKESIDRVSGSGVFARDPDSVLTFTKHENEGSYSVEMTLRNFAPVQPFVVSWKFPLFDRDDDLDPTKLRKPQGGAKKLHDADELLDLLGDQSLTTGDWAKLAQNEAGIKDRTFFTLKAELQDANRIFQSRINRCWTRVLK